MARLKAGILGGISGKIGTVVGASWLGIDYIRSLPDMRGVKASPAQLNQRSKLNLFRGFLIGINPLIKKGYQNYGKKTPMNSALSYNMMNAIQGDPGNYKIEFSHLLFNKGDLFCSWSPEVVSAENCSLDFSWENGSFKPFSAADDEAIIVLYDTIEKEFVYLEHAGFRADKSARILLPDYFSGHRLHCYLSFYSPGRKISSSNQYLGEIEVI